ncbi:MAG: cytochrome P450 [Myxococcota bacterium]
MQDVVAKVLAPIQFERELDLVRLVREVPLIVITKLLGLDEATEDSELFLNAAPDYFRGINPIVPDDARDRAELAARRMTGVLERAVENRRARPRTDMVSQVLEIADGIDDATTEDVIRALVILVAAGTDTTRLTSSLAVKTLLNHPEEFERLRADRSLVKNAVSGSCSATSPTKFLVRASRWTTWNGRARRSARPLVLLSIFGADGIRGSSPSPSASTCGVIWGQPLLRLRLGVLPRGAPRPPAGRRDPGLLPRPPALDGDARPVAHHLGSDEPDAARGDEPAGPDPLGGTRAARVTAPIGIRRST